jgi:alpha-ketoglutarate-dependent taurine dioxygenase
MNPTITPLDATLGARITDIDLTELTDEVWTIVESTFHEHGLLVFPAQHLSEDAQVAFAKRFGDIEHLTPNKALDAVDISNQKPDGSVNGPDDFGSQLQRGNEGWHTDSSYMPISAKASMLTALVVPSKGGQTEFADMRAAYAELDEKAQAELAGLSAKHSLYYSQAKAGHDVATGAGYGFHNNGAPVRPLVKEHPVTNIKALYIGRHAYDVIGLPSDESEQLLDDLVTFACQPPRTYRHDWQPGDLVIWDNRCAMHRACSYDYSEPRVLRHTRVAGDPATEYAESSPDERAAAFEPATANNFN